MRVTGRVPPLRILGAVVNPIPRGFDGRVHHFFAIRLA
jgi:hypothetical protein